MVLPGHPPNQYGSQSVNQVDDVMNNSAEEITDIYAVPNKPKVTMGNLDTTDEPSLLVDNTVYESGDLFHNKNRLSNLSADDVTIVDNNVYGD